MAKLNHSGNGELDKIIYKESLYNSIQFAVIKRLFNCKIALLGDINQSLNPQSKINLDSLQKSFPQAELMVLNKI